MSKKPRKVEEGAGAYAAKKQKKAAPAASKKAGAGNAEFERIAGKLFSERKELLHKLAQ